MKPARRVLRRAGFTLLELLAVILIIAVLATVLITQLGGAEDAANAVSTKNFLQTLEVIIAEYEQENGAYPPSSFSSEQGVPNDGDNVGVEALVVALFSKGWEAGGHDIDDDRFGNTDGDLSSRSLTDFGNRKLLEFVDHWGNPIVYMHRVDYGNSSRVYTTVSADGEVLREFPKAYKDPVKGRYYKHSRFQLISAGADGLFNTEDDLCNFEHVE
ncbi:MAG: type II secretion system protein [Planctomycetota bacterium]